MANAPWMLSTALRSCSWIRRILRSLCLRSLMSRMLAEISMPRSVESGLRLISIGNSVPSRLRPKSSSPLPIGRTLGLAMKPFR